MFQYFKHFSGVANYPDKKPQSRFYSLLLLLLIVFLIASVPVVNAKSCRIPLRYKVGTIDERFKLSQNEIYTAMADAAYLWENAIGKDIFIHANNAELIINFMYDDRQQRSHLEHELRNKILHTDNQRSAATEEFEILRERNNTEKREYEQEVAKYNRRLNALNEKITYWNEKGGSPPDIHQRIKAKQQELRKFNAKISYARTKLNRNIKTTNSMLARLHRITDDYNTTIAKFNAQFSNTDTKKGFTKGDYKANRINIYHFKTRDDLVSLIAHEFGHSLFLEHVKDRFSVMYYKANSDGSGRQVSEHDLDEFYRVCPL